MKKIDKIDLHGIRHDRVRNFLIKEIERYWSPNGPNVTVHIITGHSNRMKEIAKNVLDEYKLECAEDVLNPGYIRAEI